MLEYIHFENLQNLKSQRQKHSPEGFLEISQNSQKNNCASLFFTKVAGQTVAGKLNNCFFQNRKVKLH